jgi:hypothetical protein
MSDYPMSKPPEGFDVHAFAECTALIVRAHHSDPEKFTKAMERVSVAAGGYALWDAAQSHNFPPCTPEDKCSMCWLVPYCVHQYSPHIIRRLAHTLMQVALNNKKEVPKQLIEEILNTDKCKPEELLPISRKLERVTQQQFIYDTLQPTEYDSVADLEYVYCADLLGGDDDGDTEYTDLSIQPESTGTDQNSSSDSDKGSKDS